MNEDEISQTLGRWAKGTFAYMVLVIFNLFGNDAEHGFLYVNDV